ncbi:MAG: glycosyltransferase family 2 protein, partial [Gemmataceae bacterium]
GACLMTRRELFQGLGGFLADLDLNYSDVDYCLRLLEKGKRLVFTPYAKLYHHESLTKPGVFDHELHAFHELWKVRMPRDRYYSPNLTQHGFDYRIDVEREPEAAAVT